MFAATPSPNQRIAAPNGPTFTWPNDDQTLVAAGHTGYVWMPRHPGGATATPVAVVGDDPVRSGVVACGDGLDVVDALAARGDLQPGSIRVVYIDPPFNTGKRFGHYDDTLDEGAWLSMIRDRLAALAPFMADHSSVWVHLDETMSYKSRLLLDDVFGADAYVATVVWNKRTTVDSRAAFSTAHDPILVYSPAGPKRWKVRRNRIASSAPMRNRDGDPRGPWRDAPFTAPGYRPAQQYTIVNPAGFELRPPRGRSWYATEPVFEQFLADNRIWWPANGAGSPRLKNFAIDALQVPGTIWAGKDVGTNDDGKRHLADLFPHAKVVFDTPKPEQLLARIIHIASDPGDLVVDLFAGSGTTAAAAQKMGRRWIVAERLQATVDAVLVPRLTRVVDGTDRGGVTEAEGWTGGGAFDFVNVAPVAESTYEGRRRDARR